MEPLRKAFLDLRLTILAEIARRNALKARQLAVRGLEAGKSDETILAELERRMKFSGLWRRLRSRRPAKPRDSAIWPAPEPPITPDDPPDQPS